MCDILEKQIRKKDGRRKSYLMTSSTELTCFGVSQVGFTDEILSLTLSFTFYCAERGGGHKRVLLHASVFLLADSESAITKNETSASESETAAVQNKQW